MSYPPLSLPSDAMPHCQSGAKSVVSKLQSRWGLDPVLVHDDHDYSEQHATSTNHGGDEEEEEEPTGRVVWDCAQILWDLVADPRPGNEYAVRGKRVIELGGGTGALSVGLARAGATSVICTDLPCHLARIESTVRANTRKGSRGREALGECSCGGGGGGGGGDGGGQWVDAGASKLPIARTPAVVVRGLRWGDEEDLATVRASPQLEDDGCSPGANNCGALAAGYGRAAPRTGAPELRGEHPGVTGGEGGRVGACESDGSGAPEATAADDDSFAFDVIVLSEVLYWPALDLLQEDTREPLHRTLLGLSRMGTKVILIYKERWPEREREFLKSCEAGFQVRDIPADLLALPASTNEDPGSSAVRAVEMIRLPPTGR